MFVSVDSLEKLKPEIEFYNKTKSGVDVADQIAHQYLIKAGTRRWPGGVFYTISDFGINSFDLYKKRMGYSISR